MNEALEIQEFISILVIGGNFDFDAVGLFDCVLDRSGSDYIVVGEASGRFEQEFGAAGHFDVVDVLVAEAICFGQGAIGIDDVFLVFEKGNLIHENTECFFGV